LDGISYRRCPIHQLVDESVTDVEIGPRGHVAFVRVGPLTSLLPNAIEALAPIIAPARRFVQLLPTRGQAASPGREQAGATVAHLSTRSENGRTRRSCATTKERHTQRIDVHQGARPSDRNLICQRAGRSISLWLKRVRKI
jgi:hypothetical protein